MLRLLDRLWLAVIAVSFVFLAVLWVALQIERLGFSVFMFALAAVLFFASRKH